MFLVLGLLLVDYVINLDVFLFFLGTVIFLQSVLGHYNTNPNPNHEITRLGPIYNIIQIP